MAENYGYLTNAQAFPDKCAFLPTKQFLALAYEVGFNNPAYLAKVFREEYGLPPSELGTSLSKAKPDSSPKLKRVANKQQPFFY